MKRLKFTTCCTSTELQRLMRMTVETLGVVSLGVDPQRMAPSAQNGFQEDSRQVTIMATCSATELANFMQLVTQTMNEVNFDIITADAPM